MSRFRASTIIKEIGDRRLSLVRGSGRWCFTFEDSRTGTTHTRTVFVTRLGDVDFDQWVEHGRNLMREVLDGAEVGENDRN